MEVSSARRFAAPAWLNARTVAGLLLFLLALAGGRRILADAQNTVGMWAAARDIPADTRLTGADLEIVAVRLPAAAAERYSSSASSLEGVWVDRPIGAGELVPADALARGPAAGAGRAMTVSVDPEHAVGGVLGPGDRVDVLATFDARRGRARTSLLVTSLEVVDVIRNDAAFGDEGFVSGVTLAVTPEDALRLALAARIGEIDLIRIDGDPRPPDVPLIRTEDLP